ncbi:MAG: glycerol-3-phosphate dehydrogenase/oxidase [Thermoanaerobaculia bacterium]
MSRPGEPSRIGPSYDLLVVGGGITGAGIALEAARAGLSVLLVEQGDFASGTSSRSSKLVHGGLRYLAEGNVKLTWEAVRERDRLLAEAPGLVDPVGFLFALHRGDRPGRALVGTALVAYDLLAREGRHVRLSREEFLLRAPHVGAPGLTGGFAYADAFTDDARLVLRVLAEAEAEGALVRNYVRCEGLLRERGTVTGAVLRDLVNREEREVRATVVVNATGAWADRLRGEVGGRPRIRPLRGSHLLFPAWRFPAAQAVTFRHPLDGRPLFAYPWEGLTLLGTTDLDHPAPLDVEPSIAPAEAAYLLDGARAAFPSLSISARDAVSSFSGVRPVVGTGKARPSDESRDHVLWEEAGLLTVTGGKLTTFRLIALAALRLLRKRLPALARLGADARVFKPGLARIPEAAGLDVSAARRLAGRHGAAAAAVVAAARPGELEPIAGTSCLWAELRRAARAEKVVHLDDLLLRRVRVGLLLPDGGASLLPRVREVCRGELAWDDGRWSMEEHDYLARWRASHTVPVAPSTPALCA